MAIEGIVAGLGFRRVIATLRLWGPSLDPDEISRALRREPTEKWKKGDAHPTAKGRIAEIGMWSLKSGLQPTASCEEHINWLLLAVEGSPDTWQALRTYERDIFIGGWINHWNTSFEMNASILHEAGKRFIPITFDLYVDESLAKDE